MRVHWREQQPLRAVDLTAEQSYREFYQQQHLMRMHTAGIIRGLEVNTEDLLLEAGIAIDERGREFILHESTALPQAVADAYNGGAPAAIWLVATTAPVVHRFGRTSSCGPGHHSRERISISVCILPPGSYPGLPSVKIAEVLSGQVLRDYGGLVGSAIRHPAGTAVIQLGQTSSSDPFHFLIAVTNAAGLIRNSVAIDRQRQIVFYGDVQLVAYRAAVAITGANASQALVVEATQPGIAGAEVNISIEPAAGDSHNLSFAGPLLATPLTLANFDFHPDDLLLLNSVPKRPILATLAAPGSVAAPVVSASEAGEFQPQLSASIAIEERHEPAQPARSKCDAQSTVDRKPYVRAILGPSPAPPPTGNPDSRRLYHISGDTEKPALRCDLGPFLKGDQSRRFSAGGGGEKGYEPALLVEGTKVIVPGVRQHDRDRASVQVTGSVRPGPITPDPSNRLFRELSAAYYLAGFTSAVRENLQITLNFPDKPTRIERGRDWQYTLEITNGLGVAVTFDNVMENRRMGASTVVDTVADTPIEVIASGKGELRVEHPGGEPRAGTLQVSVIARGNAEGFLPWRRASFSTEVIEPPQFEIRNMPDLVVPNHDWERSIVVRNNNSDSSLQLTLKSLEYAETEAGGTPSFTDILTAETQIDPEADEIFDTNVDEGLTEDTELHIRATYSWAGDPDDSDLKLEPPALLAVTGEHIRADITTPETISAGTTGWSYAIDLRNLTSVEVRVRQLEHRVTGDFATVPISVPFTLPPGAQVPFEGIPGPPASTTGDLEIRAVYDRAGRSWTAVVGTAEVHVETIH